jgi:hypothetical protein
MNGRRAVAAVGWLGATVLLACSSGSNGGNSPDGGSGGGGGGGACKSYTACSLLTAADVNQALSTTVGTGMENDLSPSASATQAEGVGCSYLAANSEGAILTLICGLGNVNDPTGISMTYPASEGFTVMTVSGVGDSAWWITKSTDAAVSQVGKLIVFVGTHITFDLSIRADVTGSIGNTDPLTAAKQMGAAIVARL